MFELNYLHVSIAILVIAFCLYFKIIPFGMNVSSDDTPNDDGEDTPKDDGEKVSKAAFLELQQKYDALEAERKENERKANESKGKYKELYEGEKTKNETLQKDSEELAAYKKNRKEAIIKELPKDKRETHQKILDNINDLSLIEDYANEVLAAKEVRPGTDEGAPGKINLTDSSKITDFDSKQLKQIKEENPDAYKKLLSQMTAKK